MTDLPHDHDREPEEQRTDEARTAYGEPAVPGPGEEKVSRTAYGEPAVPGPSEEKESRTAYGEPAAPGVAPDEDEGAAETKRDEDEDGDG